MYRYLPVVRQNADETVRQFADRTQQVVTVIFGHLTTVSQQVVGKAVNLVCTQYDYDDIQKWIGSCELPYSKSMLLTNNSSI